MKRITKPIAAKAVLNPVRSPSMPFRWSINPYRGCQHGCSFCYARSTHLFLDQPADDTFQRHIFWKAGAPDILRNQLVRLARLGKLPDHVAIGTATDPYQPLEAEAKLTRGCLEVLAEFGVPFSVTTRSPLILRDLDILRAAPARSVNISLHTLDTEIWRRFEPASPAPRRRLEAAGRLAEAGVPVNIFVAPVLPYITDSAEAASELAEAFQARGVRGVMVDVLELATPEVKLWFFSVLRRHYPELAPLYGRLYHRSSRPPESCRAAIRRRLEAEFIRRGLMKSNGSPQPRPGGATIRQIAAGGADAANIPAASATVCAPLQLTLF
jgi:DNA repair photolyase